MVAESPSAPDPFETFPILRTERLLLRRLRADDADALFAIFGDERVAAQTDVPTFTSPDDAAKVVTWADGVYAARTGLRWGIVWRDDGTLVGTCGFHLLDRRSARAELGYDLAHAYWRRGIMREALRCILPFGFATFDLNRVQAMVHPGNEASAGLLRAMGFSEEGTLRQYTYFRGAFQDQRCFALLRADQPW